MGIQVPTSNEFEVLAQRVEGLIRRVEQLEIPEPPPPPPPPTPVDCVLSAWGEWTEWTPWVLVSAREETRTRVRYRTVEQEPAYGGAACGPLANLEIETREYVPEPVAIDCVLGDEFITGETPLEVCQPDGFQAVEVAWTKPVLVEPAHGGVPCGERSGTRIEKRACVYVPPPPPPPTGTHSYFDRLVARPDHWKSYSLRDAAQLDLYRHGWLKAQTYEPVNDTYHSPQDAAKITINPYIPLRRQDNDHPVTLSRALSSSSDDDVIEAPWLANGPGITYRIENEILGFVSTVKDDSGKIIGTRVNRGVHGTLPATHVAGTEVWRSSNASVSQIRLPMGTEPGNTYVATWEAWYGPETRYDVSGLTGWKNYQFAQGTGDGTLGLEVRSRMVESSAVVLAPDEVATVDMRAYTALGAGIGNAPITPRHEFRVKAATWTRYWVELDHTFGEWDYLSLWVADTTREPVKVLDRIPYRPGTRSFAKFWLEFSTSQENVKAGRGALVAYVRNVVMLRNPIDLPLEKP